MTTASYRTHGGEHRFGLGVSLFLFRTMYVRVQQLWLNLRALLVSVLRSMPNGQRIPYRFVGQDPERVEPPSPVHTSDSEETFDNKVHAQWVAWTVLDRWRLLVWQSKVYLAFHGTFPRTTASLIARFSSP